MTRSNFKKKTSVFQDVSKLLRILVRLWRIIAQLRREVHNGGKIDWLIDWLIDDLVNDYLLD